MSSVFNKISCTGKKTIPARRKGGKGLYRRGLRVPAYRFYGKGAFIGGTQGGVDKI